MKPVERIIEQIIRDPATAYNGETPNRLVQQFHRGAPLDYLKPLLLSPDPQVVSLAAWVASELGEIGKPLLDDVVALIEHPDKRARFWVIDCVLLWASPSRQKELSRVVRLIDDPEKAVRLKAMDFLSRASTAQLEAALRWFAREEPQSPNVLGLQWLLGATGGSVEAVGAMLQHTESRMRKYAAVAASRMAKENPQPIVIAASSADSEVTKFANDWLTVLRIGQRDITE